MNFRVLVPDGCSWWSASVCGKNRTSHDHTSATVRSLASPGVAHVASLATEQALQSGGPHSTLQRPRETGRCRVAVRRGARHRRRQPVMRSAAHGGVTAMVSQSSLGQRNYGQKLVEAPPVIFKAQCLVKPFDWEKVFVFGHCRPL